MAKDFEIDTTGYICNEDKLNKVAEEMKINAS